MGYLFDLTDDLNNKANCLLIHLSDSVSFFYHFQGLIGVVTVLNIYSFFVYC